MWENEFKPLTDEEIERLSEEGIRIPVEMLRGHFIDYQKLERYRQWAELKRLTDKAKKDLAEYEDLLNYWELKEFTEKYQNQGRENA